MVRCRLLMLRPPQQPQHHAHHRALVNVIPRLHHHTIQSNTPVLHGRHQILVIESAHGSQQRRSHNHIDPVVVLEVDTLLLATTAQHQKRHHSQQHTNPLPHVQSFTKKQESTHQHHHRPRSVDRPHNRQRQMLHAKVTQNPTRQHNERLQ